MSGARFDTGKPAGASPRDRVIAEINRLVGMQNIKDELNKLTSFGELIKLRRERDIPMEKIGLHMVFMGPPGTGKTILARKFGELFKAIGLLRDGKVVEVDRSTLVGTHLGDAEKHMKDAFDRARNGVLFIDEAYSLGGIDSEDVTKDVNDLYGKAAIDTLLKLMEDNRSSVMVIAAGYPDPMRRFLQKNTGLRSRFSKTFVFHPYKYDELLEIFRLIAEDWKYTVDADALSEARRFIRTWDIEDKRFGNAREVRTFFEAILPVQADRIAGIKDFQSLSNEAILTVTRDDVVDAIDNYGSRV
jgi:SpoVK/Ycf46/Vps4 family AAA+-type ATPase